MKTVSLTGLVVLSLSLALLVAHQAKAGAGQPTASSKIAQAAPAADQVPIFQPEAVTYGKKCGFDSDCPHGKCKSGQCGGCGFDSDCKGWGKCKGGQCGSCGFDSDCKGFGKCSSGRCTKSPY